MKAERYLLTSYYSVHPFSAINSLDRVFFEKGYAVVVGDNNKYYGILTPYDIIKRPHKLIIDCVDANNEYLSFDENLIDVIKKFRNSNQIVFPVLSNNSFVGIVEIYSLLSSLEEDINALYEKSIISQKVKRAFLKNISHEIRTPLNGILGFIDIISNLDIGEIKNGERLIRQSAERFLKIMNDLIELSLIESGDEIEIRNEEVNIEKIFSDLKMYFDTLILMYDKNISLRVINSETSVKLISDNNRIKQILYHLIDNAIKFSHQNSVVEFGVEIKCDNFIFFVRNEGDNIPLDKNVFEIFEKQECCDDKFNKGLGIGLSVVKKISELLKGEIYFETNNLQTIFYCNISSKINQAKMPAYNNVYNAYRSKL